MWFSLFSIVLIMAMTFFQGLQGLFSALIHCLLTILAAALAFGFYEDLYYGILMQYQPDHGRGIALMAIFLIALLVLRTLFDMLIKGNMRFPIYVDRGVGGALGLISALITVGMLAIGVQMLPFGRSFLGFSRFAMVDAEKNTAVEPPVGDKAESEEEFYRKLDYSKVQYRRKSLGGFVNPDGFTVALMSRLSNNALAGRNRLDRVYPDFLRSVNASHLRAGTASRSTVPPGSLKVEGFWYLAGKTPADSLVVRAPVVDPKDNKPLPPTAEGRLVKLDRYKPQEGESRYLVVRASLDADARDEDNFQRFTTEQVRLVAEQGSADATQEFYLAGVNHDYQTISRTQRASAHWLKLDRGETVERVSAGGPLKIDFVFSVPDAQGFKPLFVEYKQNARAELPSSLDQSETPPSALPPPKPTKKAGDAQEEQADPSQSTPPPGDQTQPQSNSGGSPQPPGQDRVSGLGPTREAIFSDQMPFVLTDYEGQDLELKGTALDGGYVRAIMGEDWSPRAGSKTALESFHVPEGQHLLQVSVEKLQPQSWLGGILGGAIDRIQNFYLVAEGGKQFMPVGMYAMAVSGGENVFELRYLDEIARGSARVPKFDRIKARDLQGDYALFFLFHVPPGTKPIELHTGRRSVDLREFNLQAPS